MFVDTVQKQTAVDLYFFPKLVVNHYGAVCDWASMSVRLGCETETILFSLTAEAAKATTAFQSYKRTAKKWLWRPCSHIYIYVQSNAHVSYKVKAFAQIHTSTKISDDKIMLFKD